MVLKRKIYKKLLEWKKESKGIKCLHLQILVLNTRIVNGGFYI